LQNLIKQILNRNDSLIQLKFHQSHITQLIVLSNLLPWNQKLIN